jgi:hypothetical protein
LASGVGAVVILAVVGLWAYGEWTGEPLGALWQLVVLAIVIGGAYRVFGKQTMDGALEAAQDLQSGDTESDDGDTGGQAGASCDVDHGTLAEGERCPDCGYTAPLPEADELDDQEDDDG